MTAARFLAVQGVTGHQFTNLQEVFQTEGLLQFLVKFILGTRYAHILIEGLLEGLDFLDGFLQAFFVTCHTHILPHNVSQLLVNRINRLLTLDGEQLVDTLLDCLLGRIEFGRIHIRLRLGKFMRQVVADGHRNDKITVGQTLHQG